MDNIGLDLHKRESRLCILTAQGEVVEQRIRTSRERFTEVLGDRSSARILLEATTESEWVAQHLETLGHEVIVADPTFAPMYATRSRRVKTDRRDARTLARYVALVKALVRREGLRLPTGQPQHTVAKLAALPLAPSVMAELAPLVGYHAREAARWVTTLPMRGMRFVARALGAVVGTVVSAFAEAYHAARER